MRLVILLIQMILSKNKQIFHDSQQIEQIHKRCINIAKLIKEFWIVLKFPFSQCSAKDSKSWENVRELTIIKYCVIHVVSNKREAK